MRISPETEQRLRELLTVFMEENAKLNLSAFRTEEDCWVGNILDSLAFLEMFPKRIPANRTPRITEIGTGGGFPLLPIAIALPEAHCTGMDATRKKIAAVERMVKRMGLRNVTLVCGRAEELGWGPAHREQYDIVLARGIADLSTLLELASPFARTGGHLVLWKSMDIEEELRNSKRAQEELSCMLEHQYRYALPGKWGERQLLIFKKTSSTSARYPRGTGISSKRPLR